MIIEEIEPEYAAGNVNYSRQTALTESDTRFSNLNPSPDVSEQRSTTQDEAHSKPNLSPFEEDPELQGAKGCCKRTRLFTGYAVQDVRRNKCHFFLAFGSVFVVVLSILVVNTIVSMGPLVFLSLGQKQNGEIDAIFSQAEPGVYSASDYSGYYSHG